MKHIILGLLLLFTIWSCNQTSEESHGHDHEGNEHVHGDEFNIDTTIWSGGFELFVEYPAFVVGHTSTFLAHFTQLHRHRPVEEAIVTVSMIRGNKGIRQTVDTPNSPGIFTPALQPNEAGTYQLFIDLKTPKLEEKFDLGQVTVYANDDALSKAMAHRSETEADISFLKEQAWKIDFQTAPIQWDTLYGVLNVAGRWMSTPGTQRTISASNQGNVFYEIPGMLEGKRVTKGQVLLRISGENLNTGSIETKIKKAKAEFEQVKAEFERKKELHQLKIVPQSEFEEVQKKYELAQANYQELLKNYSANGVSIKAPINGYINNLNVENGTFVNTGQALLSLSSERTNMIKANVSVEQVKQIEQSDKIWIRIDDQMHDVKGRVVSIGRKVSKDQPLIPVFIEVESTTPAISGSLVEVQIGYGKGERKLVIPKEALLEDFGEYRVVVQLSGEGFELRPVSIGVSNGEYVAVTDGLKKGEWIVTTGAYQVKMASMSGAVPAHGHTH